MSQNNTRKLQGHKAASQMLTELEGACRAAPLKTSFEANKSTKSQEEADSCFDPFGASLFSPTAGCRNLTLCCFHPGVGGRRALGNGVKCGWGHAGGSARPALAAPTHPQPRQPAQGILGWLQQGIPHYIHTQVLSLLQLLSPRH